MSFGQYTYIRYISDNLYHVFIKDVVELDPYFVGATLFWNEPIIKSYKKMICDGGPDSRINEIVARHIRSEGFISNLNDKSVYIDMNKKLDPSVGELYYIQLELMGYIRDEKLEKIGI